MNGGRFRWNKRRIKWRERERDCEEKKKDTMEEVEILSLSRRSFSFSLTLSSLFRVVRPLLSLLTFWATYVSNRETQHGNRHILYTLGIPQSLEEKVHFLSSSIFSSVSSFFFFLTPTIFYTTTTFSLSSSISLHHSSIDFFSIFFHIERNKHLSYSSSTQEKE